VSHSRFERITAITMLTAASIGGVACSADHISSTPVLNNSQSKSVEAIQSDAEALNIVDTYVAPQGVVIANKILDKMAQSGSNVESNGYILSNKAAFEGNDTADDQALQDFPELSATYSPNTRTLSFSSTHERRDGTGMQVFDAYHVDFAFGPTASGAASGSVDNFFTNTDRLTVDDCRYLINDLTVKDFVLTGLSIEKGRDHNVTTGRGTTIEVVARKDGSLGGSYEFNGQDKLQPGSGFEQSMLPDNMMTIAQAVTQAAAAL
jgi:hypothetical protein